MGQTGRIRPNRLSFAAYPITKKVRYASFLLEEPSAAESKTSAGFGVVLEERLSREAGEIPTRIASGRPKSPGDELSPV